VIGAQSAVFDPAIITTSAFARSGHGLVARSIPNVSL
jgi:hypothetical protein